MNTITIDNILLVEVPEKLNGFYILPTANNDNNGLLHRYFHGVIAIIPPGNWQFIGTTDAITEEIAEKIVAEKDWLGGFGWMYKNYMDDVVKVHERKGPFKSVLLSFASLLRKHNIPSDKRFAILKLNP